MKKVEYSQPARKKLCNLRTYLAEHFGEDFSGKSIKQIMDSTKGLALFETKGISVSAMYDIDCDYRYLYIGRQYLFYRIESTRIIIVDIYDEKEDFMWKLFGIDTTPPETLDYWGE